MLHGTTFQIALFVHLGKRVLGLGRKVKFPGASREICIELLENEAVGNRRLCSVGVFHVF